MEEQFGVRPETEADTRLRERIKAGRRRVAEFYGRPYAEPEPKDLSGLSIAEILGRGRGAAVRAAEPATGPQIRADEGR